MCPIINLAFKVARQGATPSRDETLTIEITISTFRLD